jgi:uncharacterized membrane protein
MAQGQRIARIVFSILAIGTISILGWTYAQEKGGLEMEPPTLLESKEGTVLVQRSTLEDKKLHRFAVKVEDKLVRFLAMKLDDNKYGTTFDACLICKDLGYVQQGDRLICRNCVAEINVPTLGEGGGCNPVPLRSRLEGDSIFISLSDLEEQKGLFVSDLPFDTVCSVCKMKFALANAGGTVKGVPYCSMKECRDELLRQK